MLYTVNLPSCLQQATEYLMEAPLRLIKCIRAAAAKLVHSWAVGILDTIQGNVAASARWQSVQQRHVDKPEGDHDGKSNTDGPKLTIQFEPKEKVPAAHNNGLVSTFWDVYLEDRHETSSIQGDTGWVTVTHPLMPSRASEMAMTMCT